MFFKSQKIQKKLAFLYFLLILNFLIASYYLFYFSEIVYVRSQINFILGPFEDYFAQAIYQYKMGFPIYGFPNISFTPYLYGPLYIYLSSFLINISDLNFISARYVSYLSLILLPIFIYLFFWKSTREKGSHPYIFISTILFVGLFVCSYSFSGLWLDLSKVDSLLILFIILSIFFYILHLNTDSYFTTVILLLGSSFFCSSLILIKQTLWIITFGFIFHLFWNRKYKSSLIYSAFSFLFTSLFVLLEIIKSNAYYIEYNFLLPTKHPFSENFPLIEVTYLVLPSLLVLVVSFTYFHFKKDEISNRNSIFSLLVILFFLCLFAGLLGRLKHGGFVNSLLYPFFVGTLATIYLFYVKIIQTNSNKSNFIIFILFTILIQFRFLSYKPERILKAFQQLIGFSNEYREKYCLLKGNVFYEKFSFSNRVYCNREGNFSMYTATDLLPLDELFFPLINEFGEAIKNHKYSYLILDDSENEIFFSNRLKEVKVDFKLNKTQRSANEIVLIEKNLLKFKFYEVIPDTELSIPERDFLQYHNRKFPKISLYRPKED